jgi:IPT/TIG domain
VDCSGARRNDRQRARGGGSLLRKSDFLPPAAPKLRIQASQAISRKLTMPLSQPLSRIITAARSIGNLVLSEREGNMTGSFLKSAVFVIATTIVMFILLGAMAIVFQKAEVDTWLSLPILTILGVTLLLATLAIVSIAFGSFGLSDKTQALALPEGSVRSVIALSLVVIFAILSVFLFGSLLSGSNIQKLTNLPTFDTADFMKHYPTARDIVDTPQGDGRHTVTFRFSADPVGVDFAKQLLVLIGTLMTAVASFYFGSKTATSAAAQAADGTRLPLKPLSINPASYPRTSGNLSLTITGENLNPVTTVRIVSGTTPIAATSILSNATSVHCTIPIDATTPLGAWDVVVADAGNRDAVLKGALTIT